MVMASMAKVIVRGSPGLSDSAYAAANEAECEFPPGLQPLRLPSLVTATATITDADQDLASETREFQLPALPPLFCDKHDEDDPFIAHHRPAELALAQYALKANPT